MRRVAVGWCLLLASVSCSDPATVITLEVTTDFDVPSSLDTIRLQVTGNEQRMQDFVLGAGRGVHQATDDEPLQVALVPQGAKDQAFTVRAIGLVNGVEKVHQEAKVSFLRGERHTLRLRLRTNCEGISCTARPNQTCDDSQCVPTSDISFTGNVRDASVDVPMDIPLDSSVENPADALVDVAVRDGPVELACSTNEGPCNHPFSNECGRCRKCVFCGQTGSCVPAGPKKIGEPCMWTGDCVLGAVCSGSLGTCQKACLAQGDCSANESCRGRTSCGAHFCAGPCGILEGGRGCGPGHVCAFNCVNKWVGCLVTGGVFEGGRCTTDEECAQGHTCTRDSVTGGSFCRKYCDSAVVCKSGKACVPVECDGYPVKVCL